MGKPGDDGDGGKGVDGPGDVPKKGLHPAGNHSRRPKGHDEPDAQNDGGDEDGGEEQELKEPGEGKVGLGDEEGEEAPQGYGDQHHAKADQKGVFQGPEEVRVVEDVAVGPRAKRLAGAKKGAVRRLW